MECIFCEIIRGKIPAPKVYEDDDTIVIPDVRPHAKKHLLVIPKTHVAHLEDAFADDARGREIIANLFSVANRVAHQEGLLPSGYRSVINTHADAGQTVFHLHLHILGGEKLKGTFA